LLTLIDRAFFRVNFAPEIVEFFKFFSLGCVHEAPVGESQTQLHDAAKGRNNRQKRQLQNDPCGLRIMGASTAGAKALLI
jgi:hypothetical protein